MMKSNPQKRTSRMGAILNRFGSSTGQSSETFAHEDPKTAAEPNVANIRDQAYVLFEKANCCHGHDVEHWFEATAQLKDKARGSWATAR